MKYVQLPEGTAAALPGEIVHSAHAGANGSEISKFFGDGQRVLRAAVHAQQFIPSDSEEEEEAEESEEAAEEEEEEE